MRQSIQRYALYLHVLALLLVIGIGAALVLVPGARATEVHLNNSSIYLSADRSMVFAAGDCVLIKWRVEGVREVYFDTLPTIGESEQRVCLTTETTPALRVVLPDDTTNEYELTIPFFIRQPIALFLALIAVLIVISFVALIALPRLTPTVTTAPNAARAGCVTRILTLVGALSLVLIITAGVLEVVLRYVFTNFGTESDRLSYVYTREEAAARDMNVLALPYIEYGSNPNRESNNSLGLRGEETTVEKPEGVYRIIAMGDSSTYGTVEDPDTYPIALENILRDEYGLTNVEVINAGTFGYTTWHTLTNFEFRVLEFEPDLVIFYQSVIDATVRMANPDCYRGSNPLRGLDPRNEIVTNYNEGTFSVSTLYRFLTIQLGLELDPADDDIITLPTFVQCGDGHEYTEAEAYALNPPVYYERNLRSLIGVAQAHGVDVLVSTFAYDHENEEASAVWRSAIDEQNEVVRRVAADYDMPFIDYAAQASNDEDVWADFMHPNAAGSRAQAAAYAAYLVEQGIIPTP